MSKQGELNQGEPDTLDPRVARREKLNKIVAMGIDPFGQRFDDRDLIESCHDRSGEVKWTKADGTEVALPDFSDESLDFRAWKN